MCLPFTKLPFTTTPIEIGQLVPKILQLKSNRNIRNKEIICFFVCLFVCLYLKVSTSSDDLLCFILYFRQINIWLLVKLPGEGGYSSLVLVGMCWHESRPIQIPIFQENVTHSYTNRPNFRPNFEHNHLIFSKFYLTFEPILAQIWQKFWKFDPFIYQILHFVRGHLYMKRLILLPMLAACPRRVFCTEYPSPPPTGKGSSSLP